MEIYTLDKVIQKFELFAPPSLAPFDHVGLLLGDARKKVKRIGLTLDFSLIAMRKALEMNCNGLITHHGPTKFAYQFLEI